MRDGLKGCTCPQSLNNAPQTTRTAALAGTPAASQTRAQTHTHASEGTHEDTGYINTQDVHVNMRFKGAEIWPEIP